MRYDPLKSLKKTFNPSLFTIDLPQLEEIEMPTLKDRLTKIKIEGLGFFSIINSSIARNELI